MSEMVERAAQAVVAKQCERDGGMDVWSELAEYARDQIRQEVRVVIEAMREPTEAMVDHIRKNYELDSIGIAEEWRAMIDAALKD